MNKNRLIAALSVIFLILMCVAAGSSKPAEDQLTDSDAVTLVRQLNSAQAELFGGKDGTHRYVSLSKLLEKASLKSRIKVTVNVADETSGKVMDYNVSLIPSSDGNHYLLGLAPKGCGLALFSNETGIIYPAKAAGCD